MNPTATAPTFDEGALMRRVMWRICPMVMGIFLLAVVDRSNVGYAKLQMVSRLGLTETAYGLASSLFFIGYSFFEVPSALAAHRFGARLWFARILLTWGLLTVMLAFTFTGSLFAAVRFLVGVAEAGAYPGVIYYLTLWFPRRYRVQAVALLTIGSPLGNMFGALFGGVLLDLDGMGGLAGWQWVFIVTGVPALLLTFAIFRYLPDGPRQATFLSPEERTWLLRALDRDGAASADHGGLLQVLFDGRVLWFSVVYTLITLALYGNIYWLPTVVKDFGVTSTQNGLLTALPWALAAMALVWLPRHLREQQSVLLAMTVIALCSMAAFFFATLTSQNWMRYAGLALGTPCISLTFPCFWYLPSQIFKGARSAAAIAAISTIGSLGGFAAQNVMPWVAQTQGSALAAMTVPAASMALLAISAMITLVWRRTEPGEEPRPEPA